MGFSYHWMGGRGGPGSFVVFYEFEIGALNWRTPIGWVNKEIATNRAQKTFKKHHFRTGMHESNTEIATNRAEKTLKKHHFRTGMHESNTEIATNRAQQTLTIQHFRTGMHDCRGGQQQGDRHKPCSKDATHSAISPTSARKQYGVYY